MYFYGSEFEAVVEDVDTDGVYTGRDSDGSEFGTLLVGGAGYDGLSIADQFGDGAIRCGYMAGLFRLWLNAAGCACHLRISELGQG